MLLFYLVMIFIVLFAFSLIAFFVVKDEKLKEACASSLIFTDFGIMISSLLYTIQCYIDTLF